MRNLIIGVVFGILLSLGTTVFAGNTTISAVIFPIKLNINGQTKDVSNNYETLNYNGSVYVPLRFITESFGGGIGYDAESRTVSILYNNLGTVLKDQRFPNISLTNLKLSQITQQLFNAKGQILIEKNEQFSATTINEDYFYAISLIFYDKNQQKVATLHYSSTLGEIGQKWDKIDDFSMGGTGNIDNYSNVELHVDYLGPNPIKGDEPPNPTLTAEEKNISYTVGSNCWKRCTDYSYAALVKSLNPSSVSSGTLLNVDFNYNPQPNQIMLSWMKGDKKIALDKTDEGNQFILPKEPGDYIIQLDIGWEFSSDETSLGGNKIGSVPYLFAINVQ